MASGKAVKEFLTILVLGSTTMNLAFSQNMETYPTVMHPEKFEIDWTGFYELANSRTAELRDRLPHHLDLHYGSQEKQRLDLYLPADGQVDAPVFVFFHGGGFQEGDRAHYGFVASPFAANGVITAVASYRLANEDHRYPAQIDDARSAVVWLHKHLEKFGGDPDAIFVGGHSAGAILAADLGADRTWLEERGVRTQALKGIVAISGTYDLRSADRPGYVDAYAPTPEARAKASPMLHLGDPAPSALVAVGTLEPSIQDSARQLTSELLAEGVRADFLLLDGEDHDDTVLSLADETSPLFRMILDMMQIAPASP
jgi:acetyl esterase/lipase